MQATRYIWPATAALASCILLVWGLSAQTPVAGADTFEVNDVHVHLTNYVQQGTNIHDFMTIMGTKVGRAAIFGIPLQQQWSYDNTGEFAPTYYLQTDAPLYYYSFTDAAVAMAYRSLSPAEQGRLDPMITGFNPADMYAADHVRRVLTTFPGVFSGIGEFTIHKEFVSAKIAGLTASLTNPALDRLLDFAGDVGLVVLIHNDIDAPFPKPGQEPYQVAQLRDLFLRHPNTTIIWAHIGLGRVVRPTKDQLGIIERALLGRNGEVHRLVAGSDRRDGRPDQPPSGSVPVRDRRGRAVRAGRLPEGLSTVPAAVRTADARGEREGAQGQLCAPFRRSATQGEGLGAGQHQGEHTMTRRKQRAVRWAIVAHLDHTTGARSGRRPSAIPASTSAIAISRHPTRSTSASTRGRTCSARRSGTW
jgi:hypothetical protein